MNKTFFKIKSGHILRALFKSITVGIAAGLLAVGVVLLALKLSAIDLAVYYYIIIAVGTALAAGAVSFLFFKPNDRAVAKAVDDEYKLQEKVQTALEFENEQGAIVVMQREDANERIKSLPRHKPDFKKLWVFPLAFVLAAGVAVAGILTPLKQVQAEDDPYDRPPTRYEVLAMQELIENVESSNLGDDLKADTLVHLNVILDGLEEFDNVSDVMPDIENSITSISESFLSVKEYDKLAVKLLEQRFNELSDAAQSADGYKEFNLNSYDLVLSFESSVLELITAQVEPQVNTLRETYANLGSTEISAKIYEMSGRLQNTLSVLSQDGSSYKALTAFKNDMDEIRVKIVMGTADEAHMQHNIDLIFYDFEDRLIEALKEQSYTQGMGVFVVNRIKIIFGMPIDDDKHNDDAGNKEETPGSDPGDGDVAQGGIGDHDVVYGSDDMIYDPDTGKYVTYGELLNKYFAIVQEYLNGETLNDTQKEIARYYFEILFSGIKEAD